MAGEVATWHDDPRWYLWDGGFLVLGRSEGVVPPHDHHAIQIVIALDGEPAARTANDGWRSAPGIVVRPDVVHSYDGKGAAGAMLFVDPESSEGRWLGSLLTTDITCVPASRLHACLPELRRFCEQPLESMDIRDLIRHCLQALCAGAPPMRRLDPRVAKVLHTIRTSGDLRIPLESAAATACLSPSRFAHMFKEQVGLPFRRYILWRKLARAMLEIGRNPSIAAAAHAADFADAAHLTRTFHQMFGIPPSVMMRGRFHEIASPFEATAAPA